MTNSFSEDLSGLSTAFGDFGKNINTTLDGLLDNRLIKTGIIIFLVFYASFIAPNLPKDVKNMIKDKTTGTVFRVIIAFIIILLAGSVNTMSMALLLAIGVVITLQNIEDKSPDITISEETDIASWIKEDGIETNEKEKMELENFNSMPYENQEYFKNASSSFTPVEESSLESNKPRHLPYHSVNTEKGSNIDVNKDGIYNDDYTTATNSLLTFNLNQNEFTDNDQLNVVQSNQVPEADQNKGIVSMNPQQGPQGLNSPIGYNY